MPRTITPRTKAPPSAQTPAWPAVADERPSRATGLTVEIHAGEEVTDLASWVRLYVSLVGSAEAAAGAPGEAPPAREAERP